MNYDKNSIVVNTDTKKHIAELKAEAKRKKAEEERKKAEEAARKKREKEANAKEAWLNGTVYVTKSGSCYHSSYCPSTTRSNTYTMRRKDARRRLRNCSRCNPDREHPEW